MATVEVMHPGSSVLDHRHRMDMMVDDGLVLAHERTNPELESFTSRKVEELLESVIVYIESQLDAAVNVSSPAEIPDGIQDSHSRQIDVCLARFRTAKTPAVSIRDYLHRLHLHCPFSNAKLLAIVHYLTVMDLLYLRISKVLRLNTVHRLILTAVVIASKVLDGKTICPWQRPREITADTETDRLIPQVRWSVVGGITLHQLHGLELAFFFLLHGKCWITETALIHAGHCLTGRFTSSESLISPLMRTSEADVIWSSVGNRRADVAGQAETIRS